MIVNKKNSNTGQTIVHKTHRHFCFTHQCMIEKQTPNTKKEKREKKEIKEGQTKNRKERNKKTGLY